MPTRILFVCLGNICRSPLAEALFKQKLDDHHVKHLFTADSAGTSDFHRGELPDTRTLKNAEKHGIEIQHLARQFTRRDFQNFDIIVTMDFSNRDNVLALAQTEADRLKVKMLLDYSPGHEGMEVPDPWFGGDEGFEQVFNLLNRATNDLLVNLIKEI